MITHIETIDDMISWLHWLTRLESSPDKALADVTASLEQIKQSHPYPFKVCTKCRNVYPATKDYFRYTGQGRLGLSYDCKFCHNSYLKARNKTKRKKANGNWSPEYLEEVNRVRSKDGLPSLGSKPTAKPGRPKKVHTPQLPPKPGELW